MTPGAVAYHKEATVRGKRAGSLGASRARYHRERAALASILKNYGLVSLVWIVPLYFVQGLIRVVLLALTLILLPVLYLAVESRAKPQASDE